MIRWRLSVIAIHGPVDLDTCEVVDHIVQLDHQGVRWPGLMVRVILDARFARSRDPRYPVAADNAGTAHGNAIPIPDTQYGVAFDQEILSLYVDRVGVAISIAEPGVLNCVV